MYPQGLRWKRCDQCSLTLLSSDMNIHVSEGHSFDQTQAVSGHIPFIREGILVANFCTIEDLAIKHRSKPHTNFVLYLHPDTMTICKFKKCQPILLNNRVILETHCSTLVPEGSVAIPNLVLTNIFGNTSDMAILDNLYKEHWDVAWICKICVTSWDVNYNKTSSFFSNPLLYKGKHFVADYETFVIDWFGDIIKLEVDSVVSKRNFLKNEKNDITSKLSSLSLAQTHKDLYLITDCTRFVVVAEEKKKILSLSHIGGMKKLKDTLTAAVEKYFGGTNQTFYKGCLLHGVQGSGKSSLVNAISDHYNIHVLGPQPSDLISENFEEYLKNLSSFEDLVSKSSPCFVFFDNIEHFCPLQTLLRNPNGSCIAEHFNTFLHNLSEMRCFVIAATRDILLIHPSLQFFELVLQVPTLSKLDRFDVLKRLIEHHEISHAILSDDNIKILADLAHGFSGYDLNRMCLKIKMKLSSTRVSADELFEVIRSTGPSILRDVVFECPNVKWEDVGGQEELKEVLKWNIEMPIKNPSLFKGHVMKGILLYGPPGCSKTMIIKALSTECRLNFLWVQGSQLHGKYVGDSEQAIKVLFKKARSAAPCVIFFDELDAFAPKRGSGRETGGVNDRCVSVLMTEMDGIVGLKDVFIIAATNRPDFIDPALLRAGRFDTRLYVCLPNLETRMKILHVCCQKGTVDDDVDLALLAEKTEGYSCAEVTSLFEFAGNAALTENNAANKIKMKHFMEAISSIVTLTKPQLLQLYDNLHF